MKLNKYKLKISIDTSEAGQWTINLVLHRPDNKQDIQFVFHVITSGYLFMDQVTRVGGPMLSYTATTMFPFLLSPKRRLHAISS